MYDFLETFFPILIGGILGVVIGSTILVDDKTDYQKVDHIEYRFNQLEKRLDKLQIDLVIKPGKNGDCEMIPFLKASK